MVVREIEGATKRQRQPVRGGEKISYLVGKALATSKVEKYFRWTAGDTELNWERNRERVERDVALDGIYVLRTNVPIEQLDRNEIVLAYKRLATVDRAFRSLKSVDLNVRPIHHRLPNRVRAHVFLSMLAYYVEWHMRQALAPVLFDDEETRGNPPVSCRAGGPFRKSTGQSTAQAYRRQLAGAVFQDWLKDLATIVQEYNPASAQITSFL